MGSKVVSTKLLYFYGFDSLLLRKGSAFRNAVRHELVQLHVRTQFLAIQVMKQRILSTFLPMRWA